jgi:glycine oxidase
MGDVIVVGGGVIGLSIALELAEQGASVTVLERGDFGREASWAGAGILPPGNLAAIDSPEAQLRALSHALWPTWAGSLVEQTGIDVGYRRSGGLEVRLSSLCRGTEGDPDDLEHEVAAWRAESITVQELTPADLAEVEPAISPEVASAYRLPDLGQVRNPRLLDALVAACAARGVRLCAGCPVLGFDQRDGRITAVRTEMHVVQAGRYCVAGGAWSRGILTSIGVETAIEPVRGQIVLVSHLSRLFSHVIQVGPRYLVPRDDGRILIGATEEHVGFEKKNTACAVSGLLAFGTTVVPAIAEARFEKAWSGLRPGCAKGLPYLGRVPGHENLFIAAGHFRSGLQMSPGTARVMRQAILDQETDIPLESFACDRLPLPILARA